MPEWTPEVFEADDGTVPFERFIAGLSDTKFAALDAAIAHVLAVRGIELTRTEWLKALGDGLHEFRVRHDAEEIAHMFGADAAVLSSPPEAILLRVFVHFYGQKVVLLLGGYDKAADPNKRRQQREIDQARRLLTQFRERHRRTRAQTARPSKARAEAPSEGLTTLGEKPIMEPGGHHVAKVRSYDEVAARRRNAMAPDAKAERDVFAEAYDIAMQVVALRERAGLTQAELAERTGIDQGDISRIERGATSPTARTLQRIAEALDADVKLVARVH